MVPASGQTVALDPLIDDMNVGMPVTVPEVGAAKDRLDEQFGFPEGEGPAEYRERMQKLNEIEECAADSAQGGLVRVDEQVAQKLRLGERELRRRKQRR